MALILAVPFLDLIWGEGRRRKPRAGATGEHRPLPVTQALDYVRVFRKAYPLSYVCGKIESRNSVASGSTQYGDNSGTDDDSTTIDVGSWLGTLARNWWVIVGLVVLGIVVGAVVTKAQPKEYTATASVYIGQTTDANGNPMAGLNSNAKAAVQLLASQVVLKEAADRAGMDISASRLRKETTVETPSSTVKTTTSVVNIVVISVTDTDDERAAAAANALSEVLLERLESGVDEKITLLEEQLAQNQKEYAAATARSAAAQKALALIAAGGGSATEKAAAIAPYMAVIQVRPPSRRRWPPASRRPSCSCSPPSRWSSRASCTTRPSRTRPAAPP